MKKAITRIVSLLLVFVLLVGYVPGAFAEERSKCTQDLTGSSNKNYNG